MAPTTDQARLSNSELARYAEDVAIAGAHTLSRVARRREDTFALEAIQRARDWLIEHVAQELRRR